MLRPLFHTLIVAGLVTTACTDADPIAPEPSVDTLTLGVMSRNIYIGADVDAVIAAIVDGDPGNDAAALGAALQTMAATDFATRAEALADEIAGHRPHVVGLQEVTDLFVSQAVSGLPADIDVSYLPILLAALDARGLNYEVGDSQLNIDAAPYGGAVRLRDYDAVLYDADRAAWETVRTTPFTYNIGEIAEGITLNRGWIWGEVTVDAHVVNVVVTHLEAGGDGVPGHPLVELRAGQALEIVMALEGVSPVVIMGDLNDLDNSPMHDVFTGAAFSDVWTALRPADAGNTCCHEYDLSNATADFYKRIDYLFTRGFVHPGADYPASTITLLGDDPADRVDGPFYPLWPSDHGGMAVQFLIKRPVARVAD
jgi:endonuclease/exonuclease/phosphatase family metal-dependent hydrolase